MLSRFLPLGARLTLQRASKALRRGDVDAASDECRAYLATRLPVTKLPLRRLDARVAALAAMCAVLRGDKDELKGAAELVEGPGDRETTAAQRDVEWCEAASKGTLKTLLADDAPAVKRWPWLAPLVTLVAVERSFKTVTPKLAASIRARLVPALGSPELQARATLLFARLAILEGDRAEAARVLSMLRGQVGPRLRALAAMARLEVDEALEAAAELPADERRATLELGASLVFGASSAVTRRVLDACGPQLSASTRAALAATLGLALAREGERGEALSILRDERSRDRSSSVLAVALAYVALLDGDAAQAMEVLRGATTGEAIATPLLLCALALGGFTTELAAEAQRPAAPMPDDHAAAVAPIVLAALARRGIPPGDALPKWLRTPPEDAPGLFAWGLVRLLQGADDDALRTLTEAVKRQPELAELGDAADVARLAIARSRLLADDFDGARDLAEQVRSPRLEPTASRLLALVLVKRRSIARKVTLRADNLPAFIQDLQRESRAGSAEAALLDGVSADLGLVRARTLLREGNAAAARAALLPFRDSADPDVAYLTAAVALCDGARPLEEVEAELTRAAEASPSHAGLQVLLAEVSAALRGADAGIKALEAARAKVQSPMIERALVSAYHSARRGIEAKRVGFAVVRRAAGTVPPELRRELAGALALEVPPPEEARPGAKVTRRPASPALPPERLAERVHVFFARAAAACEQDKRLWPAMEATMQRLKRSLMTEDLADALAAERELMSQIRRARK